MYIQALARELYRQHQRVHKLEQELDAALAGQRATIKEKLRRARAEWQQLRNALDSAKSCK